ncbi:MAG: Ig-like domain-containing protein [Planctomycetes bacterium]|nr:Ig-like domain-containing protein [Planctomycetota bacterium]
MHLRRTLILGLGATALSLGAAAAAQFAAHAAQNPIAVERFLLGYMDKGGRFIPTAGRGATNVDRNALVLFVMSGAVDTGANIRATLPLTLAEQEELTAKQQADPNYDPRRDGYEPGVIPRKRSTSPDSLYVATGSVSNISVVIASNSATGLNDAPGQYFKVVRPGTARPVANRFIFNPRFTVATFGKPGEVEANAQGFQANTTYLVGCDGGKTPQNPTETLRNLDGYLLASRFATSFTTTSRYIQDYDRPEFKSTFPGDQSTNVAYDSDIDIEFSEPMDASTFLTPRFQGDDQWTINVRYSGNVAVNGALSGRNVLGTVRVKPQTEGKFIQFRPLQGFGKGPYEIECVVTNGVTDLSGNNILRQFQISFKTERNASAEDFSSIDETFGSQTYLDTKFVATGDNLLASWNAASARGLLTTTVQESSFDVFGANQPTGTGVGVNVWFNAPIKYQFLFPPTEMGSRARTISGFWWVQGTYYGRTYPACTLQLGHASDAVNASGFPSGGAPSAANYSDTPLQVVSGVTYSTTNATKNGVYVKGPDFIKTFNYDGTRSMIFEMANNGDPANNPNSERWRADTTYPINAATVTLATGNVTQPWLFSTLFNYLSPGAEAQSLFYDIGRGNARLLPQQVVPVTQPSGTSVVFQWQGAKESATNASLPDLTTLTGWVADIRQLSNYRYIRFLCTLQNNTGARTSPSVDILTIPYVYK